MAPTGIAFPMDAMSSPALIADAPGRAQGGQKADKMLDGLQSEIE